MADYGHELSFGTFLTPQNQRPHDVVALAQLTERVGLDFVTFQDHPYQPAFLDTWTLLSWVAARTEHVGIAPNVLNIPLRPPAVVARAAASLDLLSGGRVSLGLGAGGFWDAIAAMGGTKLTPGQAVDALSEAVDVIRGMWDTSTRRGVHVDGRYHRVQGAKRGPEPAHDIPLWIGAYKPRMLRLTGTKGDGWLPSQPYIERAAIPAANRAIDAAAEEAGRDPREIRRLFNVQGSFAASSSGFLQGPPGQWVEELAEMALEHGFSAFFMGGDDPGDIDTFANEVVPAVRELVAGERGGGGGGRPGGAARPVAHQTGRVAGIDYEALPPALAADAVEPSDMEYANVRSTYVHRGSPGIVLRPRDAAGVSDALRWAREQDVPLAIRSGGHGIGSRSTNDGGIVIDLGALNGIEVIDRERRLVRLGAGARWADVAQALDPQGLAITSGDYGGVGVGGLATAGGIGFLGRSQGLTIDRVRAVEVVLADGSKLRADAGENPDLFWGMRGAGANFGVATAFELEAGELGEVVFHTMVFDARDTAAMLASWGAAIEAAPRELTSFLHLIGRDGRPLAQVYSVYANADEAEATEAIAPLAKAARVLARSSQVAPYSAVLPPHAGPHTGGAPLRVASGLADSLHPALAEDLGAGVAAGELPLVQFRAVGGAINDVDPRATAYAHRTQAFSINGVGGVPGFEERWESLRPHMRGLYISFESEQSPARLADAFPGDTLDRLRDLKARYDPDNVFAQNFSVAGPQQADGVAV